MNTMINEQRQRLKRYTQLPLIAILRGIKPDEVVEHAASLIECGLRIIEVPLNSPSALLSIERLATRFGGSALIGAGTVLSVDEVDSVMCAGGQLVVTPNTDIRVVERCAEQELISMIGFLTPTEAIAALHAGATALKLFPASSLDAAHLSAIKAVLPGETPIFPVGGIDTLNMKAFLQAGASGFGMASNLYRPGYSTQRVALNAERLVAAFQQARL